MRDTSTAGQPSYLDFYVAHFSRGADDGPAHQRREDVRREVRPGIAALHKLVEREDEKTHSRFQQIAFPKWTLPSLVARLTPVPLSHTITLLPLLSVIVW